MIASENDTQRRVSSGDSRTLEELNFFFGDQVLPTHSPNPRVREWVGGTIFLRLFGEV